MSTGTSGIKLYARNNIFKKRTSFDFWGPALGRFSQFFLSYFSLSVNHGGRHFYSAAATPPYHKSASYGPAYIIQNIFAGLTVKVKKNKNLQKHSTVF